MFLVVILTVLLKRILSEKTGQPQCLGAYVMYSLQLCLLQVWTVKTYTTECIVTSWTVKMYAAYCIVTKWTVKTYTALYTVTKWAEGCT